MELLILTDINLFIWISQKDQVSFYNCEFDGVNNQGKVEFNGLEKTLGKMVYEFFQRRITEQYPLEDGVLDPYQQAKEAHEVGHLGLIIKTDLYIGSAPSCIVHSLWPNG